jgi:hypothetical protein
MKRKNRALYLFLSIIALATNSRSPVLAALIKDSDNKNVKKGIGSASNTSNESKTLKASPSLPSIIKQQTVEEVVQNQVVEKKDVSIHPADYALIPLYHLIRSQLKKIHQIREKKINGQKIDLQQNINFTMQLPPVSIAKNFIEKSSEMIDAIKKLVALSNEMPTMDKMKKAFQIVKTGQVIANQSDLTPFLSEDFVKNVEEILNNDEINKYRTENKKEREQSKKAEEDPIIQRLRKQQEELKESLRKHVVSQINARIGDPVSIENLKERAQKQYGRFFVEVWPGEKDSSLQKIQSILKSEEKKTIEEQEEDLFFLEDMRSFFPEEKEKIRKKILAIKKELRKNFLLFLEQNVSDIKQKLRGWLKDKTPRQIQLIQSLSRSLANAKDLSKDQKKNINSQLTWIKRVLAYKEEQREQQEKAEKNIIPVKEEFRTLSASPSLESLRDHFSERSESFDLESLHEDILATNDSFDLESLDEEINVQKREQLFYQNFSEVQEHIFDAGNSENQQAVQKQCAIDQYQSLSDSFERVKAFSEGIQTYKNVFEEEVALLKREGISSWTLFQNMVQSNLIRDGSSALFSQEDQELFDFLKERIKSQNSEEQKNWALTVLGMERNQLQGLLDLLETPQSSSQKRAKKLVGSLFSLKPHENLLISILTQNPEIDGETLLTEIFSEIFGEDSQEKMDRLIEAKAKNKNAYDQYKKQAEELSVSMINNMTVDGINTVISKIEGGNIFNEDIKKIKQILIDTKKTDSEKLAELEKLREPSSKVDNKIKKTIEFFVLFLNYKIEKANLSDILKSVGEVWDGRWLSYQEKNPSFKKSTLKKPSDQIKEKSFLSIASTPVLLAETLLNLKASELDDVLKRHPSSPLISLSEMIEGSDLNPIQKKLIGMMNADFISTVEEFEDSAVSSWGDWAISAVKNILSLQIKQFTDGPFPKIEKECYDNLQKMRFKHIQIPDSREISSLNTDDLLNKQEQLQKIADEVSQGRLLFQDGEKRMLDDKRTAFEGLVFIKKRDNINNVLQEYTVEKIEKLLQQAKSNHSVDFPKERQIYQALKEHTIQFQETIRQKEQKSGTANDQILINVFKKIVHSMMDVTTRLAALFKEAEKSQVSFLLQKYSKDYIQNQKQNISEGEESQEAQATVKKDIDFLNEMKEKGMTSQEQSTQIRDLEETFFQASVQKLEKIKKELQKFLREEEPSNWSDAKKKIARMEVFNAEISVFPAEQKDQVEADLQALEKKINNGIKNQIDRFVHRFSIFDPKAPDLNIPVLDEAISSSAADLHRVDSKDNYFDQRLPPLNYETFASFLQMRDMLSFLLIPQNQFRISRFFSIQDLEILKEKIIKFLDKNEQKRVIVEIEHFFQDTHPSYLNYAQFKQLAKDEEAEDELKEKASLFLKGVLDRIISLMKKEEGLNDGQKKNFEIYQEKARILQAALRLKKWWRTFDDQDAKKLEDRVKHLGSQSSDFIKSVFDSIEQDLQDIEILLQDPSEGDATERKDGLERVSKLRLHLNRSAANMQKFQAQMKQELEQHLVPQKIFLDSLKNTLIAEMRKIGELLEETTNDGSQENASITQNDGPLAENLSEETEERAKIQDIIREYEEHKDFLENYLKKEEEFLSLSPADFVIQARQSLEELRNRLEAWFIATQMTLCRIRSNDTRKKLWAWKKIDVADVLQIAPEVLSNQDQDTQIALEGLAQALAVAYDMHQCGLKLFSTRWIETLVLTQDIKKRLDSVGQ